MPSDILKSIESSLKGEEVPESVVESSVSNEPEIKVESSSPKISSDNSTSDDGEDEPVETKRVKNESTEKGKLSRRQQAAKESQDRIARLESSLTEERRQREATVAEMKQLADLKPFAEELKRVQEQQRREALQKDYTQDPTATIAQLVQAETEKALAPLRERERIQETNEFTNKSFDTFKKMSGSDETFNGIKPYIRQVLINTANTLGPQVAEILARNPEAAFRMARDMYNEQNQSQQKTIESENIQKKQELAKINASISKPNQVSRTSNGNGKNGARSEIDNFLLNYSGQKRS